MNINLEKWDIIFNKKKIPDEIIEDVLYKYLVLGKTLTETEEEYWPTEKTSSFISSTIQQAAGLSGRNSGKYRYILNKNDIRKYVRLLKNEKLSIEDFVNGGYNQTSNHQKSTSNLHGIPFPIIILCGFLGAILIYLCFSKEFSLIKLILGAVLLFGAYSMNEFNKNSK